MPTIFDRWATEQPSAATKYADVSIARIVTEDDNEERITDKSRIKELTLRFIWRQQPLTPDCFTINFGNNDEQRDPVAIPHDQGTDFVFRSSAGAPGLAKARYVSINVNQVPTGAISDDYIAVTVYGPGQAGSGPYRKAISNIDTLQDLDARQNISGLTADTFNMIDETTNHYVANPESLMYYDLYQREGMVLRQSYQRLYPLPDNVARTKYPFQYYSFSFNDSQRVGRWCDAVMVWRGIVMDTNGISMESALGSVYQQSQGTTLGYTVLLYRQKMDISFYGLRPNKKATYTPAQPSSNGLLSATTIATRADFWEL